MKETESYDEVIREMGIAMHEKIMNSIISYVKDKTGLTIYDEGMLMTEIEINSLQYVELIVALEDEFFIEFNTDLLLQSEFKSLKEFIDYVEKEVSMHNNIPTISLI